MKDSILIKNIIPLISIKKIKYAQKSYEFFNLRQAKYEPDNTTKSSMTIQSYSPYELMLKSKGGQLVELATLASYLGSS